MAKSADLSSSLLNKFSLFVIFKVRKEVSLAINKPDAVQGWSRRGKLLPRFALGNRHGVVGGGGGGEPNRERL